MIKVNFSLMKNKRKKRSLLLLIVVMTAFLLNACSEKDPLLGTWKEPVSGITLEFNDDNTLVISRSGTSFTVDYEKRDPNIIAVTGSDSGAIPIQSMTYEITVDDQLIITVDKVPTTFERVK